MLLNHIGILTDCHQPTLVSPTFIPFNSPRGSGRLHLDTLHKWCPDHQVPSVKTHFLSNRRFQNFPGGDRSMEQLIYFKIPDTYLLSSSSIKKQIISLEANSYWQCVEIR